MDLIYCVEHETANMARTQAAVLFEDEHPDSRSEIYLGYPITALPLAGGKKEKWDSWGAALARNYGHARRGYHAVHALRAIQRRDLPVWETVARRCHKEALAHVNNITSSMSSASSEATPASQPFAGQPIRIMGTRFVAAP